MHAVKRIIAGRGRLVRYFGSAILSQGLLSATNLAVGLILVRRASPAQYGYYVLVNSAIPLLAQLQSAFIGPILPTRISVAGERERREFAGGLLTEQNRLLAALALLGFAGVGAAWAAGWLDAQRSLILGFGAVAAVVWLAREFFRMLLLAYRRPHDVLAGDGLFAVLLIAGVWLSTSTPMPAVFAILSIAVAAASGGALFARTLHRHDPWERPGTSGALLQAVRVGIWTAVGAGVHWLISQGYSFLVAARLSVTAVAAIAATRLLLSPLGVFSIGISTLMFPTASVWLRDHGLHGLWRRILGFVLAMCSLTAVYLVVIWLTRDWIFLHILKRDYPDRDRLLFIWSLVFICTVIRDQIIFLLIARRRWRLLAISTSFCAVLGLSVSYLAIGRFGAAGGLLGLLVAEGAHVIGVVALTLWEMRAERGRDPGPGGGSPALLPGGK